MPPIIASLIFAVGILGLFSLDRHQDSRVASKAVWIPALWLFLISSRPLSVWLGIAGSVNLADPSQALEDGSPIDRNLFIFLLLVAMGVLVARRDKAGVLLRRNSLILMFFVFCAASIFWSAFPFVAFKRWTKALGDLGIVLIILSESDPLATLKNLLTRLGFLIFPLSILFIKYYPDMGRRLTKSWTIEPIGVSMQKNELGLDCMLYGVFFVWMFVSVYRDREDAYRRRRLLAYGTIIGMVIWLLSQCNSTTSIVGFSTAAIVTWIASRPSRNLAVVHVLVFVVLGMATTALFFDPGGGMVGALGKDSTLTGRTQIWGLVLGLHTNPWIGTGFESFWLGPRLKELRNALDGFPVNEAHNAYVEVYLNLGWVGISFIALFVITGYRRVISSIRRNRGKGSLLLGFLLCTLFYSFTEAAFRLMSPAWVFLLLVMIAGSQAKFLMSSMPSELAQTHKIGTNEMTAYATLAS